MRRFTSTRSSIGVDLEHVLLHGLAPDGGLFVPRAAPRLLGAPPVEASRGMVPVAAWSAPFLFPEVAGSTLRRVIEDALSFPVPLIEVEPNVYVLELFHGPTHAFKDVGARFLARLVAELDPGGRSRTVLVATSGDTGAAVASAFHGLASFRVVVLFPRAGISATQRRQMTTLGGNVEVLAVRGSFDDCQRLVKEAFKDAALGERHALMSANSINLGRLLPQCLCYLHAAAELGWSARPARYVVPSGNLGNLCAGLIARRMGMPAVGFLAAANANRAFVDMLAGAPFRPQPSIPTASSAMDVGDPSNLERILWLFAGDLDGLRAHVAGASITDAEATACIAEVHRRTGYVLDPHSAVAYAAQPRHHVSSGTPNVVMATAHPAKFPEIVEAAIGREVPIPPGLVGDENAREEMQEMAPTLDALRDVLESRAR